MSYRKALIIKLSFTVVFSFILVIHAFNIWGFKLDAISLILIILVLLPWFLKYVDSLDIPGLGKLNVSKMDHATRHVDVQTITKGEDEIKIKEFHEEVFSGDPNVKYLSFKARIFYPHEAGAQYLLQIKVNDYLLDSTFIINKENLRKIGDGRTSPTFNVNTKAWSLVYSPDFVTNYSHPKYKVLNFDPYLFVFNISSFTKENKKIKIYFSHIGNPENEAQNNSIILRDVIVF